MCKNLKFIHFLQTFFFIHDQANNSLKSEFWQSFLSQPLTKQINWRHLNVNKRGVSVNNSATVQRHLVNYMFCWSTCGDWRLSVAVLIDHDSSISIDTDVFWTPYNLQLTIDWYFSVASVNNHDSLPTSQPRYRLTCWLFQDINWLCWPIVSKDVGQYICRDVNQH